MYELHRSILLSEAKEIQLLARYSIGGNSDMINAITVSLLELLNFEDGKA